MLVLKADWKRLKHKRGKKGVFSLTYKRKRIYGIHRLIEFCSPSKKKGATIITQASKNKTRTNLYTQKLRRAKRWKTLQEKVCTRKSKMHIIKDTRFLFMSGNGIMVDQQLSFFVTVACRNFKWFVNQDGFWDYRLKQKDVVNIKLDTKRKMWQRIYQYNKYTLSKGQKKEIHHYFDRTWKLSICSKSMDFEKIHPMVLTLLTFFWKKRFLPVAAQIPVACFFSKEEEIKCGQSNVGTFIDLLMFEPPTNTSSSKEGTLWVIELKKMQQGPTPNTPLHYKQPLGFVPFSQLYSAASIQALFGETLLKLNYKVPTKGLKIKSAVLRICTEGVGFSQIPRRWISNLESSLPSMSSTP